MTGDDPSGDDPPAPEASAGSRSSRPPASVRARELLALDDESEMSADQPDPLIADLVEEFLRERRADAARLPTMLATRDFKAIKRLGHNLRGCGTSYGFRRISTLGAALEVAASDQDAEVIQEVSRRMDRFLAAL